ncbi:hypothetical protein DPMN_101709 [Dreissena polymorpha]|uniref:Uncharacterized protein n=1 Tax=Dreissena polymorpha TaxID=45954 RepID=A0A9D4R9D2_DREPO|nr:hypothetical protein DPMN_101709 [Dreissena polymorpha]
MKLHRYIDHDSRMTPIDFEVTSAVTAAATATATNTTSTTTTTTTTTTSTTTSLGILFHQTYSSQQLRTYEQHQLTIGNTS